MTQMQSSFFLACEDIKDEIYSDDSDISGYVVLVVDGNGDYVVKSNSDNWPELSMALELYNHDLKNKLIENSFHKPIKGSNNDEA